MSTADLTLAFLVGRDSYLVDTLAYRGILDEAAATLRFQSVPVGSQVWADWLTVDAAGLVTIPNLAGGGAVPWASITGTPTTLAGYGIASPLPVAEGGTGAGAFTPGSLIFAGAGVLTEDNANAFWDDTNNYLGLGTASPVCHLHVKRTSGFVEILAETTDTADSAELRATNGGSLLHLVQYGSTFGGTYAGVSFDSLSLLESSGSNLMFSYLAGAAIFVNGSVETARLTSTGRWGLGEASPTAVLHLKAGTAAANTAPQKFTAGTLLGTPELGALEFVDDGTTGHLYITQNVAGVLTRLQII